jgi:twitching motility two-component system response regulator PilG
METKDFSSIRGLKVLVIDDSTTIRRGAEIFLNQAGCQVLLAKDGFEALAKVAENAPDVIFCDVLMPRLDGFQTCALIKRHPRFGQASIVMLSSRDSAFDFARGRMVGSIQYLTKPFTKDALLSAVQDHSRRDSAAH